MIKSPRDVFSKIGKNDFLEILCEVNAIQPINVDYLYLQWLANNPILSEMQEYWQSTLNADEPDYSIYSKEAYLNEVFLCWREYSRRYLKLLDKWLEKENCPIDRYDIKKVLDLGCGLAFTTIGLKAIFPNAECYGTNEPFSVQILYDKYITKEFDGIHIVDDNFGVSGEVDVVFASEFFEHLQNPIEFLNRIIRQYKPKYIIFANTFTNMAIGHFYKYQYNGQVVDRERLPMLFSKCLKYNNYVKVETNFYNNRPNVYMRVSDKRRLF